MQARAGPIANDFSCRWSAQHCEISGWGMQEYNNTNSYPDSVRAAKITVKHSLTNLCQPQLGIVQCLQVNNVPGGVCDYLYGRDVDRTGKFCAGGSVDACQVIIMESSDW